MCILHMMTNKVAREKKVRLYFCIKRCSNCGSYERYNISFAHGTAGSICTGCCPEPWVVNSVKSVNKTNKDKISVQEKLKRKNWSIPVVFDGFNTI